MSLNPEDTGAGAPPIPDTGGAPPAPAKEPTAMQTSLALVKNTVKQFDAAEAGLARLRKKYENVVFDLSTTKGMKEATDARMAIREPRYAVTNALNAAKKPINALKADITARAEALTAEILKLETPIHEQIVAEEARKTKEREEREAADRVRILAITERIGAIRATAARASECRTAARVKDILTALQGTDLTGFDEFENDAIAAHTAAVETVTNIHTAKVADETEREERRLAQEAEDARLKEAADALAAQQAELARQQKELADQQAAFQAQQAAAVQTFQQAAAEHEDKPLPVDASPAKTAMHGLTDAAVAAGRAIVAAIAATEPARAPAAPADVDLEDDKAIAQVSAGFDAAMRLPTPSHAEHDGSAFSFTDEELMDAAIEAVAGYFAISEQAAMQLLAAIRQWTYQGHALAA